MEHMTFMQKETTEQVKMEIGPIQVRVAEAYHRDAGKGIARIDVDLMKRLGLENGDENRT